MIDFDKMLVRVILATRWLSLSITVFALAACSFGPDGKPPMLPSVAALRRCAQPERTVTAQGVQQRFEVGAKPVPEWWKLYRSDALNALVDEGLRNSPSLAATDKSLAAAREQLRAQIGSSLLPSVDLGGQATRERGLGVPEFGPSTTIYNVFVGQVQLQYTFDLFGALAWPTRRLPPRWTARHGNSMPPAARSPRTSSPARSGRPRCMLRSTRPSA